MGPLLIVAPNYVGFVFGIISIISSVILIAIYLMIKDSPLRKSTEIIRNIIYHLAFFRPFEPDSAEDSSGWDFGEDEGNTKPSKKSSSLGYQQAASAEPKHSSSAPSTAPSTTSTGGSKSPSYNPFAAEPGSGTSSARSSISLSSSSTSSTAAPAANPRPTQPSGLEEVDKNPFDAMMPPPTDTSLGSSSNAGGTSRNPNNPFY